MNKEQQILKIPTKNLSKRLFWDTNPEQVDMQEHKSFIVSRVLEYGTLQDWKFILSYYGLQEIAQIATTIRILDKKALAFIAVISGKAKEEFRCYTDRQSVNQHLNF
jgi:hypothetical protein